MRRTPRHMLSFIQRICFCDSGLEFSNHSWRSLDILQFEQHSRTYDTEIRRKSRFLSIYIYVIKHALNATSLCRKLRHSHTPLSSRNKAGKFSTVLRGAPDVCKTDSKIRAKRLQESKPQSRDKLLTPNNLYLFHLAPWFDSRSRFSNWFRPWNSHFL